MIINLNDEVTLTVSESINLQVGDTFTIAGDFEYRPWWKFWQRRRLKKHTVISTGD